MSMKFQRATIYGFGKWVDKTFMLDTDSIHCFYGENEVGKTTLQHFILFVLFGLPPRKRKQFYPKQSNQFGGSLTVLHDQIGKVTIERTDKRCRCLLPDGTEQDEAWLQRIVLGGMTENLYRSIYAFSARDLLFIRQMKRRDISDVLFSIGLTGATAIYDVEKKLERRMDQLFKRTGKRPRLNEALMKTDALFKKVSDLQQTEATYAKNVREKIALEEKLHLLENDLQSLRERLAFVKQQYDLYPVLREYKTTCEKIATFDKEMTFPEQGLKRYEEVKERLIPLQSERHLLMKRIDDVKREHARLRDERDDESLYEQLCHVFQQRETYEQYVMNIEELARRIEETDERIANVSREVGVDTSEVVQREFPYQMERQLADIKRIGEHLHEESDELQRTFHVLTEKEKRLRFEKDKVEKKLLKNSDVIQLRERVRTYEHTLDRRGRASQDAQRQRRAKRSLMMFVFVSFLSILFPLLLKETVLYVIPIFLLTLSFWQYRTMKQLSPHDERSEEKITKEQYDEAKHKLDIYDEQMAQLRIIDAERQQISLQRAQWEEEKTLFAQKENEWIQQVNSLLQSYPFLEQIDPVFWYDILEKLRELKRLDDMKRSLKAELEKKRTFVEKIEQELYRIGNTFGSLQKMTMADVRDRIERYDSIEKKIEQIEEQLDTYAEERALLDEKITRYEQEKINLFTRASVENEEHFYEKAQKVAELETLSEQKEKLLSQLQSTFSEQSIREVTTEHVNRSELKLQLDKLRTEIDEKEMKLADWNRKIAALDVEITQLESSYERSEANFQFHVQRNKTYELAKQYAVYKIAHEALQRAKERYQEKFLRAVMQTTSKHFSYLTGGKYVDVYPPQENEPFQVEAHNNIRYTVEELSEGTIDQLYISLRLAMGNVMYNRYPFPFMIDDAFLHFDDQRTENFIQILRSLDEDRQLFVFTCKRSTAELFSPSTVQIESYVKERKMNGKRNTTL